MGFTKSEVDPNLYFILVCLDPLILILYMDSLFLKGTKDLVVGCKENLATELYKKDIGLVHYFLVLEV
jgi:hypothetical protein